ncbi:MAG: recombinase family protein [Bradyrhizobium sp.]
MTPRTAAYARYSSDRQSPASIQDQLRNCRGFAEQREWVFQDEHVYPDEALSGAGADRPGLVKLLDAAGQLPRPFDVVLLDDTSRLSRNIGDIARVFEKLNFTGIRIIAVSQGIDSHNEQADVLMTVHSLVDSLYIKELAKKTHRGLEGRALKGLCTGGRCYGYDNIREGDAVRQQINAAEAVIVRRIFELAANDFSLKTIARTLNAERVPSPRPRAGKQYATWCPTAIRAMLRRELYVGRIVWNRARFVKQPGTNKRLRRERPESEWLVTEQPELRIISADLWERVQARIVRVAEQYTKPAHPGLLNRASTSPYLMTGFLKCGSCGANLVIVTGRTKGAHPKYGCPQNFYRGTCPNGLKERSDWLEDRLLSELQQAVMRPEVVDYAISEFERQLHASLTDLTCQTGRMRQRSEQIQQELRNLVAMTATCGPSPALIEGINQREQELKAITGQLLAGERGCVSSQVGQVRQFVTERLGNIRGLLAADVQRAKAELARHISTIEMIPQGVDRKGHYIAAGEWDLLGREEKRVRMVAGEGFEPSTFGL